MSRFRVIIPRYADPLWGDFGNSLYSMERGMKDMDRQFGDVYNTFLRLMPAAAAAAAEETSHDHDHSLFGRHKSCDVGFPDASVQNPIVTDKDGNRHMNMKFDVRQFKPEEIQIKTFDDNKLEVTAKHEVKDDNHHIYREYRRVLDLPEGVDLATLKSHVHPNGVLSIEAPLPAIEAPKAPEPPARNEPIPIAIQHEKKTEQ